MPRVSGAAVMSRKPACRRIVTNSSRRLERTDRLRQIGVRAVVARHKATDARQHVREVREVHGSHDRDRRNRELEDREPSAGPQHAVQLANSRPLCSRRCGSRRRSSPRRWIDPATGTRVASPRTSVIDSASPARRIFSPPIRSIAAAKSTPTARRAPRGAVRAAIATSPVPVHRSSSRSDPVSASESIARFRHRLSMPALRRWLSKSYRSAIASNIAAIRSADFDMSVVTTLLTARGAPPPLDNTFAPQRSVYPEQNVAAA